MMEAIKSQKTWASYVPWSATGCFIFVTVGMIIWAVGTQTAYTNTNNILHDLQIGSTDTILSTIHSAGIAAVVVLMLMALLMVAMAVGRTSLERKIDEEGKVACGTWLWLAILAILASVWWLIVLWLVFVIFGSCVWYAAAFTVEGALSTILTIQSINPVNVSVPVNTTSCPQNCFNLAYFSHLISYIQDNCICSPMSIQSAYNSADAAANALHLTIAGSFIMWAGASFLLMVAVGAFATTRRERELLLRAQNNAAHAASSNLARGGASMRVQDNPAYYRDTHPLLGGGGGMSQGSAIMMVPPGNIMPVGRV
ncbi:hypothetical protein CEUSTIGMA_g3989.t1 [Chlamydomonas eustigma]|uniref:Uncharacterized protein n=1 Tax=Chlamydomonas eustigma TaxID=1157962 RepID=A0A250X0D8_9CHLO|nr:hypothetical protein CEUSTIGMA_g3989.t1 [Chlamydomonas eustigma]|eukprot:GAX76543.1 hypothetical protein CEUSTIGMA_g3989.t1 [Chlamydomonas eustigma]